MISDESFKKRRDDRWDKSYPEQIADQPASSDWAFAKKNKSLTERLRRCWNYHAGNHPEVDSETVADRLEQGLNGDGEHKFGGAPFFEIYLTVGLSNHQNLAAIRLHEDYAGFLRSVANGQGRYDSDVDPQWWGEFYMHLTEDRAEKDPRIMTYEGHNSLKSWLRITLGHFLLSLKRKKVVDFTDLSTDEENFENTISDREQEAVTYELSQELLKKFQEALKTARKELTPDEWSLVVLYRCDSLSNDQIARSRHVSAAAISKKRNAAEQKFGNALMKAIREDQTLKDYEDELFDYLKSDTSHLLFEFINENCRG